MKKKYMIESTEKMILINGKETIFVQITPHSYSQYINPLKNLTRFLNIINYPQGWAIGSPIYYDF